MSGRKGKRRQDYLANDLTLYDFADSARPAGCTRIKKGAANSTIKEVKKLSGTGTGIMQAEEEEVGWFDKDIEDFDVPLPECSEDEEEDNAKTLPATVKGKARQRGRCSASEQEKTGVAYPSDLWYVLSQHIDPEDVRKFATLCKDAYGATRTCQFWRNVYERFYNKDKELPADLKPHSIERIHGLRARCIRALYFLSPVLSERVQPKGPFDADPHSLIGYRCLLVWHQPSQGKWHFCFKLQKPSLHLQTCNTRPAYLEDIRKGYNNLFYNPEEGCCVLQVTSSHFASTSPHVMGQLLSAVHMSLSHGFRHQRLRLSFDSTRVSETQSPVSHDLECVLDPAMAVRIYHWWDPNYPFPT